MVRIPLGGYLTLLGAYLKPQRRLSTLLGLLFTVLAVLQLGTPQLLRQFVDAATGGVVGGLATPSLVPVALLYLVAAVTIQAATVAETFVAENLAWTATNRLRADLALHCLTLDIGFHKTRTPGEFIERIDGDVTLLANFFSRFVVSVAGNAVLVAGAVLLLFLLDIRLGIAFAIFSVITFLIISSVQGIGPPWWEKSRRAAAAVTSFLDEHLAGLEDLQASGAHAYVIHRLAGRMQTLLRADVIGRVISVGTSNVLLLMTFVSIGMALFLGAALYAQGALTIGGVYLVLTYATMLQRPLEQLNRQLQDLQQASAGIYRVQQLLNQHSSLPDTGTRQLPAGPLTLEFDRVTFRYEDGEPALRDVHFRLPAGQHLGLVGRTGSGKTTVARLCSRLYDPSAGSVRLGGIDLRDVPLAEVSRRVAVISQEVHLFRASVRDNVTLFDPRVPDAQINAAIQRVGLGGWLASLPNGLDTQVFAASGLSAGEAQLLALVRVFLRDPGLIILDEATARLDVATERQLEHALAELLQGRTTVIVAHRLTTVQQVDQILVMQEGEVTEDGARAALAANAASRFAALLRMAEVEVVA